MISVEEATQIIHSNHLALGFEVVELEASLGRVLDEELYADRDFPPYDRVTMDGIAIKGQNYIDGKRVFRIQELCAAGDPKVVLADQEGCIEIMTGAIMPEAADSVVRYEDLEIADGFARIFEINFRMKQNVHFKGSDQKEGNLLIRKGRKLTPAEIGVAASIGKSNLKVKKMPKIAVISSGDELVDVSDTPAEHQVRKSNVAQMQSALQKAGFDSEAFHIIDNYNMICNKLEQILEEYDVLILSGGVSKGKKDFIPEALESVGVKKAFHKVKQRPGKPFWFGTRNNLNVVFALPGNPVSSFMCLYRYVVPWLQTCVEENPGFSSFVSIDKGVDFKPDLTYFVPVKTRYSDNGMILGTPVLGNGSGDFVSLLEGDGFAELPKGNDHYPKGGVYKYYSYR